MSFVLAKPRLVLTFPKKVLFQASKIPIFKVPVRLFFTDSLRQIRAAQRSLEKKGGKGSGMDVDYWLLLG